MNRINLELERWMDHLWNERQDCECFKYESIIDTAMARCGQPNQYLRKIWQNWLQLILAFDISNIRSKRRKNALNYYLTPCKWIQWKDRTNTSVAFWVWCWQSKTHSTLIYKIETKSSGLRVCVLYLKSP